MNKPKTNGQRNKAYPLRFDSAAEKQRFMDAAKSERKTLREWLLELGRKALAA